MNLSVKKSSLFRYITPTAHTINAQTVLGKRLTARRRSRSVSNVANKVGVPPELIQSIEAGQFNTDFETFLKILRVGYGIEFEDLVCESIFTNQATPDSSSLPAMPEHWCKYTLTSFESYELAHMLIGGNLNSYMWAVPMNRVKNQPIMIEYLEILPRRMKDDFRGCTPYYFSEGAKLAYIIYGAVFFISNKGMTLLKRSDSIYIDANNRHQFKNDSQLSRSLMLVVHFLNSTTQKQTDAA